MCRGAPHSMFLPRSTRSGARRPRGVTVFAIRAMKPAQPSRKNGAATPRPPVHVGSSVSSRSFPPPMRRHVACSGCLPGACSSRAGKRRAGAPARTEAAARSPLTLRVVERRRPRGVTVFANRAVKQAQPSRKNGAATPRPPASFCSFSVRVRSAAHAPSRRVQRVAVSSAYIQRGHAPPR
jgi:hypothetical protein